MITPQILRKLDLYKSDPELQKAITNQELADLVLVVMGAVKQIDDAIKAGRLDGKTPEADKDYLSAKTTQALLNEQVRSILNDVDSKVAKKFASMEGEVSKAIERLRQPLDGQVTDEEIQRAAQIAYELVELPNFEELFEEIVTANPNLYRDGLESITDENDKLAMSAVGNLLPTLEDIRRQIRDARSYSGGGMSTQRVLQLIAENSSTSILYQSTEPSNPDDGDLWIDTSEELDPPVRSDTITKIVALTQAEYDALTPVATTLYVITT